MARWHFWFCVFTVSCFLFSALFLISPYTPVLYAMSPIVKPLYHPTSNTTVCRSSNSTNSMILRGISAFVVVTCLASPTDAWTSSHGKNSSPSRMIRHCHDINNNEDNNSNDKVGTGFSNDSSISRRKFLWQSSFVAATCVPSLFAGPSMVFAEDIDEKEESLETAQSTEESTPVTTATTPAVDKDSPPASATSVTNSDTTKQDTLVEEEKELMAEIATDEKEEAKAVDETNKLIVELEEQLKEEQQTSNDISSSDNEVPAQDEEMVQRTKNLIDALEKEEEKIETETKELITKMETFESELEDIQSKTIQDTTSTASSSSSSSPPLPSSSSSSSVEPTTSETKEIINKLKERVEEKEDLIARLKRESAKDIDPKTGKFKVMDRKQFKERAPSDFDFVQYLKESVTNTEEFERDLDAFQILLDERFGPVVKGVRTVESRVGPVVEKVRTSTGTLVEEFLDKASKDAL